MQDAVCSKNESVLFGFPLKDGIKSDVVNLNLAVTL